MPNKCSCCWLLVWRAWCNESTLIKFLKVCQDFVMCVTFVHCSLGIKQKSYLTNQLHTMYQIDVLKFNFTILTHVHLSWISKKEKADCNFDFKHQERSFGTNWCSGCCISKKTTCRQAIKIYYHWHFSSFGKIINVIRWQKFSRQFCQLISSRGTT